MCRHGEFSADRCKFLKSVMGLAGSLQLCFNLALEFHGQCSVATEVFHIPEILKTCGEPPLNSTQLVVNHGKHGVEC